MMDYIGSVGTRSELVGKAIWFLYCFAFEKRPELENRTYFEVFLKTRKVSIEEFIYSSQNKYLKFMKTNKPF